MKSLPENISFVKDGEVLSRPTNTFVDMIVKNGKVKDFDGGEDGAKMPAKDVAKNLLLQNFRTKKGEAYELPDEMSAYSAANDICAGIVEAHNEASEVVNGQKEAEKLQKQQEAKAKKEAKDKEDATFATAGNEFEEFFVKKATNLKKKQGEQVAAMLLTVTSTLPKNILLSSNGLGVTVAENATRADIASATAAVVNSMEGVQGMMGALQFAVGDLINGAVANKAYRTKGDACGAIKLAVKEKLQRNFNLGTLNYYALMAERVTIEQRKAGVNPSLYLEASKLTPPRLKDKKPSEQIQLDKDCAEARDEIISKINAGEIKTIKDAKDEIATFKSAKGIAKEVQVPSSYYMKRLFYAVWIKKNLLGDKDEVTVQLDVKTTHTYTRGELTDIEEDALNNLQNMLIKQKLESLVAGFITKGKGDKAEKIPYLLDNPFDIEVDAAPEKEEEEKEEEKEEVEEEETEETEEETEE